MMKSWIDKFILQILFVWGILINFLVKRNLLYVLFTRVKTNRIAQKVERIKEKRGEKLILSFTTIGARIGCIDKAIRSFLDQGLMADEVCLVISEAPFFNNPERGVRKDEIPEYIREFEKDGKIRIVFTDNIGPYTKIMPILKEYYTDSNALIITGDDDTIYPYDWILNLYRGYLESPGSIIAYRCRYIQISNGYIEPYNKWGVINPGLDAKQAELLNPLSILPTGKGGILYCPSFLPELVFNRVFLDLCPFGDDLWLRFMSILKKIPIHIVQSSFSCYPIFFPNTRAHRILPLFAINSNGNSINNDAQVENIIDFLSKQKLLDIKDSHFVVS